MRKAIWLSFGILAISAALAVFFSRNGCHETSWLYPSYLTMEKQIFTVHEATGQPLYYTTPSGQLIDTLAPQARDDWHAAKLASLAASAISAVLGIVLTCSTFRTRMEKSGSLGMTNLRRCTWLCIGIFLVSSVLTSLFSIAGVHETTWTYRPPTWPFNAATQTFVVHQAVDRGFYFTGPSGQLIDILAPQIRDDWHTAKLVCLTISAVSAALGIVLAGWTLRPRIGAPTGS